MKAWKLSCPESKRASKGRFDVSLQTWTGKGRRPDVQADNPQAFGSNDYHGYAQSPDSVFHSWRQASSSSAKPSPEIQAEADRTQMSSSSDDGDAMQATTATPVRRWKKDTLKGSIMDRTDIKQLFATIEQYPKAERKKLLAFAKEVDRRETEKEAEEAHEACRSSSTIG